MGGLFEPLEKSLGGLVAGLDEAGRGALAGPVSVGLALFEPAFFNSDIPEDLADLDDSKRLSPGVRNRLLSIVRRHTLFASCVMVSSETIDSIGINPATEKAMIFLVRRLHRFLNLHWDGNPAFDLLIDGNYRFTNLAREPGVQRCESIVRGDSRILSIAAASILAKVLRDRRMVRYARYFPGYDLAVHKGYGTETHRAQIRHLGLSPIHRKSFGGQLCLFPDSP